MRSATIFLFGIFSLVQCVMYTNKFGEEFYTDCGYDYPCRVFCPFEKGYVCWRIPQNDYGTLCTPGLDFNPNTANLWRNSCPEPTTTTSKPLKCNYNLKFKSMNKL
jgi:hypothetical protein